MNHADKNVFTEDQHKVSWDLNRKAKSQPFPHHRSNESESILNKILMRLLYILNLRTVALKSVAHSLVRQ
jgi:hypothetical protein